MSKRAKANIIFILEAAAMVFMLYAFAYPYKVEGSSMEDNYFTGDRVFISHFAAWCGDIDRGDVIVCDLADMRVIKRVIAIPGDSIEISNGKVMLNGVLLDEPYLAKDTYTGRNISLVMGSGEYFVMGDNRGASRDSRHEGCVKKSGIRGKVIFKI